MRFLSQLLIGLCGLCLISCQNDVLNSNLSVQKKEPLIANVSVNKAMKSAAYKDESLNQIYGLLFCDDVSAYQNAYKGKYGYPWDALFNPETPNAELQKLFDDRTLETRVRILAARTLQSRGVNQSKKQLLGVVIEVDMGDGLDTLAAYEDGTARYINYSEKIIIWDTKTAESDDLVKNLFDASRKIVEKIGPWDSDRLPAPSNGHARLSFLVTDGIYFGEAPQEVLMNDPEAGRVFQNGAALMNFLIEKSQNYSE